MTTNNPAYDCAREAARRGNGEFGHQIKNEPTGSLTGTTGGPAWHEHAHGPGCSCAFSRSHDDGSIELAPSQSVDRLVAEYQLDEYDAYLARVVVCFQQDGCTEEEHENELRRFSYPDSDAALETAAWALSQQWRAMEDLDYQAYYQRTQDAITLTVKSHTGALRDQVSERIEIPQATGVQGAIELARAIDQAHARLKTTLFTQPAPTMEDGEIEMTAHRLLYDDVLYVQAASDVNTLAQFLDSPDLHKAVGAEWLDRLNDVPEREKRLAISQWSRAGSDQRIREVGEAMYRQARARRPGNGPW